VIDDLEQRFEVLDRLTAMMGDILHDAGRGGADLVLAEGRST
jgi:hypothetical protein